MPAQLFVGTVTLAEQRVRPMIAIVAITNGITVTELAAEPAAYKRFNCYGGPGRTKFPIQAVCPNGSSISTVD